MLCRFIWHSHTHTCVKASLLGKLPSYRLQKNGGRIRKKRHGKEAQKKARVTEVGVSLFGGRCRDSSSPVNSPHHRIISHNHIASQPHHHISSHHIKQQPITSHRNHIISHHITSHWHNMTITSHHIISSDLTLRPTTWHHTASYRFPHHITPEKRNQPTTKAPPDGTEKGCCALKKLGFGWLPSRAFYRQLSFFAFRVFLSETFVPVLLVYFYRNIYIQYKNLILVAWMPDLECGIGQERLPPPNLNHQKHPTQKPTVFVNSTVEHILFHANIEVFHGIPWFLPITFFPSKTLKGLAPAPATWD